MKCVRRLTSLKESLKNEVKICFIYIYFFFFVGLVGNGKLMAFERIHKKIWLFDYMSFSSGFFSSLVFPFFYHFAYYIPILMVYNERNSQHINYDDIGKEKYKKEEEEVSVRN